MEKEYSKTYKITRLMHARSCAEVIIGVSKFCNNHKNLEILLQNPQTKEFFQCRSIMTLITNVPDNFYIGKNVNVIARGEYKRDMLEGFVEEIGRLFISDKNEAY